MTAAGRRRARALRATPGCRAMATAEAAKVVAAAKSTEVALVGADEATAAVDIRVATEEVADAGMWVIRNQRTGRCRK